MSDQSRGRVLVVDDTAENLTLLSRILTNSGFSVQAVETGAQALEAARATLPDLILLDIAMPQMDGFETCARLKKAECTRDIPVIFISALDAIEDKVRAFRAGGVDYITKPFEHEEVQARVDNHLATLRLRDQLISANRELAARIEELDCSQQLLREHEGKLQAFVNALPNLSFVIDEEGRFLEILANETSLLSAQVEELKGKQIKEVMPPEVAEKILVSVHNTITTGKTEVIEYKTAVLAGDERWFEGRIALMEKDGNGHSKVVLIATEVSDRIRLYQEIQRLAIEDPLTGCFNRRHFFILAEQELQRCVRYQHHLSLIMMDMDHFKDINDTFGHPTGDKVLCALVELCQKQLRNVDILGRYGGEEFVILMPETSAEGALLAAERIRKEIARLRVDTLNENCCVTASIGIASLGTGFDQSPSVDRLLKRADQALYAAKGAGRNCIRTN